MKGHIHFRHQRLSAIHLIVFAPFLLIPCPVYLQACAWLVALYHGLLGLMVMVEDYVPHNKQAIAMRILQLITAMLAVRVLWYVAQQTWR